MHRVNIALACLVVVGVLHAEQFLETCSEGFYSSMQCLETIPVVAWPGDSCESIKEESLDSKGLGEGIKGQLG